MKGEFPTSQSGFPTPERPPLESRPEFLRTIPSVTEEEFTPFTNLKTDQAWAILATAFGYAFRKRDGKKVFWKTLGSEKSLLAELDGYRLLRPFFRSDQLQRPVGIDFSTKRIFYDFLEGASTLWELRFSQLALEAGVIPRGGVAKERIFEVVLDVESRKNKEILRAYKDSISFSTNNAIRAEDKETSIMPSLLEEFVLGYKRLLALDFPTGIPVGDCSCTVDEYFAYNFVINGRRYDNLNSASPRAIARISSPVLYNTILAVGFGDGKFGNLMIDAPEIGTPFHFIDYDFAGFHNPFLDIARGIWVDCFFTAALDLLVGHAPRDTKTRLDGGSSFRIEAKVSHEKRCVLVTHNFWDCHTFPGWDAAGVQIFAEKYFNVLLPLVSHLNNSYPEHAEDTAMWKDLIGGVLFACGALRTTISGNQRSFFLNACLGLELLDFSEWLEKIFRVRYGEWLNV